MVDSKMEKTVTFSLFDHCKIFSLFPLYYCCVRGAGQEVGRSCIMLEFKNKKIMVRIILEEFIV